MTVPADEDKATTTQSKASKEHLVARAEEEQKEVRTCGIGQVQKEYRCMVERKQDDIRAPTAPKEFEVREIISMDAHTMRMQHPSPE